MRVTDGSKYHCPFCQSRCRSVGCMFWQETAHNYGECIVRFNLLGLPIPKQVVSEPPVVAPKTTTLPDFDIPE